MIDYVIYGNTDYLDVLEIQTDYMFGRGNLTLCLNKNELELKILYSKYNNVIFYDNNDTYAKRVLSCIEQINLDYFLFIHDIDILLNVNDEIIHEFFNFLKDKNFDRIDLKYTDKINSSLILRTDIDSNSKNWEPYLTEEIKNGIYLIKQDNINDYIYNVNPSIWKKESFIQILKNFQHKTYRTIEEIDVQQFSKQFKIFKIYSDEKINCGYFICLKFFVFLHISHSGKFLPLNKEFKTVYGQPYNDISDEYIKIVDKYNLKKSNKWII